MRRIGLFLLAVATALVFARWQAAPSAAATGSASLCTAVNFGGTCVTLTADTPLFLPLTNTAPLIGAVKSVRMNSGIPVALYDGGGYSGRCVDLIQSVPDLSVNPYQFSGQTASVLFGFTCQQVNSPHMTLFADRNFGGSSLTIEGSVPDLRDPAYNFNDVASSISVSRDTVWAVYSDINYTGNCETVTEAIPWLGAMHVGNDAISSVRSNWTCAGPAAQSYVADVAVVTGSSADITCPANYTKKSQDLNQGVGGDFVYACVQYTTDMSKAVQELYVEVDDPPRGGTAEASAPGYYCNGSDKAVHGDLNSGANNALDTTHPAIWFCEHYAGTSGGGGNAQDPNTGLYTRYFTTVPSGTRMRDLLFFTDPNTPPCVAECQVAAEDITAYLGNGYLEFATTGVPLCQGEHDGGWFPAFWPWQTGEPETERVPADAGMQDLNRGLIQSAAEHQNYVYIFACVREGPAVQAADLNVTTTDTIPPTIKPVAVLNPSPCVISCVSIDVPNGGTVTRAGTVTLTWVCTDNKDPQPTVNTAKETFTANGTYTRTGTCTDASGNKGTATFTFTIKV